MKFPVLLMVLVLCVTSISSTGAIEIEVDAFGSALEPLTEISAQQQIDALLKLFLSNKNTGVGKNNNWSPHLQLSAWSNIKLASNGLVSGLFLNDLDIQGDLLDLEPLLTPSLRVLQLNGNGGLSGDISLLSKAPNLVEIWFFNHPKIYGDIGVFTKLTKLVNVGIYKCTISGDVGEAFEFAKFPDLRMFVAPETKVTGDVSMAFNKHTTPELRKLNFLKVSGLACDLDLFASEFPQLEALGLSNSFEITGDVASFSHCKELEDLRLWNTMLKGDVKVFQTLPKLAGLNLHHTYVSGDASFFETCCAQLKELHLWKTDTKGDSERMRSARGDGVYVDW